VYIPRAFEETRREALHDLIRQDSFGTLVSQYAGEMIASHLPFLLDSERGPEGTLLGHMARANPQWQSFEEGPEVMAIFQGPHAYISPSWYQERLSVPTWNYAAVHAYGIPSLVENDEALYQFLDDLVRAHEAPMATPWRFDLPADYVSRMMKGIVGFEIRITRLEGKLKLSQNRSLADQQAVVEALIRGGTSLGLDVAELMVKSGNLPRPAPAAKGTAATDD
jgi:transcriptional regulator